MFFRVQQFSGIAPKLSRQLIPENMARDARNCRLLSGELRGIHALTPVHEFPTATNSAVRLPTDSGDLWLGFLDVNVDFVKGPLVNDTYDRHYWTGDSQVGYFSYNTLARLIAGDPAYRVGVPVPTAAPELNTVVGGNEDLTETRAYVFTFVNELGEESAPSAPVLQSGPSDGEWQLTQISATPSDMANRCPVIKRRVYRTVTGQASSLFYFVTDIDDMVTTTFNDDIASSQVVQNTVCQSFDWDPPPDDLKGLIAHPSGFLAAFKGREVYFSDPYRPWAWPVSYIVALEHDVVGLAIYGNMVMVLTESMPYYLAGSHPSNLSATKSQSIEPCLSKRSIVATLQGVLYASPNGLVLFNEGGARVVTNDMISRDEWGQQFTPSAIKATQRGLEYLAFRDGTNGFEYSPSEPLGALSTFDRFGGIEDIFTDRYNGKVYVVANNTAYEWDNPNNTPVYYTWMSKEFDFPRPVNFGACIIKMDDYEYVPPDTNQIAIYEEWNEARQQRPLNPLGYTPLGGSRWALTPSLGSPNYNPSDDDDTAGYDRRVYSLAGSPIFDTGVNVLPSGSSAILTLYADRRQVARLVVRPNETMRLPSGFKAHYWQFKLEANVPAYSVAFAETGKELMNN